jgi:hypothetical protein
LCFYAIFNSCKLLTIKLLIIELRLKGNHGDFDYWIVNVGPAVVGIDENKDKVAGLKLSPNPATGLVNVTYNLESTAKVTLEIYDLTGRKITSVINNKEMFSGANNIKINLYELELTAVIYLIKTTVDDKVFLNKLIKTD